MNKVKVLSIVSIGLLAANLFLIWHFMFHRPPPGRGREPKFVIIERLKLDDSQQQAYEKLIVEHRKNIRAQDQAIMKLKDELYASLSGDIDEALRDSLILEIGKAQEVIELVHFEHFRDIKGLCRPDQLSAFKELTLEIAKLFSPRRHEK